MEGEALRLADPGPVPGRVGHLGGLLGQRPVRERRPQRRQALQGCKGNGQQGGDVPKAQRAKFFQYDAYQP